MCCCFFNPLIVLAGRISRGSLSPVPTAMSHTFVITLIEKNVESLGSKSSVWNSNVAYDIDVHCYVGIVNVVNSHTVGRGFASRSVIPKTIIKIVQTASLHMHACVRVGV